MKMSATSGIRVVALAALAFFASQFIEAPPANAAPASSRGGAYVQQPTAPQKSQKPAAAERQPAQAAPEANPDDDNLPPDIQQQMRDLRRELEQQAINRMRNGRSEYGPVDRILDALIPFLVFVGVTLTLIWILRLVLDNRRWYKMVKVQTETHAKLLDRFGSSQDMLAYMSSDAGKKFLESPIFEGQRQQASTLPIGRILWSAQLGTIGAFLGAGILFLRGRIPGDADADTALMVFGTLILALGIGFLVSGGVSYVLGKYFGLFDRPETGLTRSEHNA